MKELKKLLRQIKCIPRRQDSKYTGTSIGKVIVYVVIQMQSLKAGKEAGMVSENNVGIFKKCFAMDSGVFLWALGEPPKDLHEGGET